ncbi:MAG: hypothetical protein NVSMB62_12540 [Acidobacteriaceae bacterium]
MQSARADILPRRRRIWVYLFLAAAVLLGAIGFRQRSQPTGLKPVASRKPMTLESLLSLNGAGEWTLAGHRGQVILINYWATWCGPCKDELPTLAQVSREYTPKGVAMIGISMDAGADASAKVRQFAARFRVPYPVALPAPDTINTMVFALPTTLLIDRYGRIAKTYQGAVPPEEVNKDLAALLAED